MQITEDGKYAVTNRNPELHNRFITVASTSHTMAALINGNTCRIDAIYTYSIFTKCPKTGESGWDIHLVCSTDFLIKKYPHFDCIISRNDCAADLDFIDYDKVHNNDLIQANRSAVIIKSC